MIFLMSGVLLCDCRLGYRSTVTGSSLALPVVEGDPGKSTAVVKRVAAERMCVKRPRDRSTEAPLSGRFNAGSDVPRSECGATASGALECGRRPDPGVVPW
jgi:hypothetical protein